MSKRGTFLLLVVLCVLCAGYWYMRKSEQDRVVADEKAKQLFAFTSEDIVEMTVTKSGEQPVLGVREADGGWRVTAPIQTVGSRIVWGRVAKALAELKNERTISADPDNLETYSLHEPKLVVSAKLKSGETVNIQIGTAEPTQTKYFALAPDGSLILIMNTAFSELNRSLLELRDRFLVRSSTEKGITRIEYSRIRARDVAKDGEPTPDMPAELQKGTPQATVIIEKDADGIWQMIEPEKCLAHQEMATRLAAELQFDAGEEFIDAPESLSDYGLDPPGARITAYADGNPTPQTLYFGGAIRKTKDSDEMLYVKRADTPEVFLVTNAIYEAFPTSPLAFRDRRLLTRGARDLNKVEYTKGDRHFVFELNPEKGWTVIEPPLPDSDQEAISNFIGAIASVNGQHFPGINDPAYGLGTPDIKLTLHYKTGEPVETIVVGAPTGDGVGYYAMQDIGVVTVIPVTGYNQLVRTGWSFRDKVLLRFDKQKASELSMVFEGQTYKLVKENAAWKIVEPAGKTIENQSDVDLILDALVDARIVHVESDMMPADLTPYGVDAPIGTLQILENDGGNTRTFGPLRIGAAATDNDLQRYATLEGRPELFRVEQRLVTIIREALRGIAPAMTPPQTETPVEPAVAVPPAEIQPAPDAAPPVITAQ